MQYNGDKRDVRTFPFCTSVLSLSHNKLIKLVVNKFQPQTNIVEKIENGIIIKKIADSSLYDLFKAYLLVINRLGVVGSVLYNNYVIN